MMKMLFAFSKFDGSSLVQMPFIDPMAEDIRNSDARTQHYDQRNNIESNHVTEENAVDDGKDLYEKSRPKGKLSDDFDEPPRPGQTKEAMFVKKDINPVTIDVNSKKTNEVKTHETISLPKRDLKVQTKDSDSEDNDDPNDRLEKEKEGAHEQTKGTEQAGFGHGPSITQGSVTVLPKKLNLGGQSQSSLSNLTPKGLQSISFSQNKPKLATVKPPPVKEDPQRASLIDGLPKLADVDIQDIENELNPNVQPIVKPAQIKNPKPEIRAEDKLDKIDIRDEKDNADSEEDEWNLKGEKQKAHIRKIIPDPHGKAVALGKPNTKVPMEGNSEAKGHPKKDVESSWVFS